MTAPGGWGETGAVYALCQIFKANPDLHYSSITIHDGGVIDVAATGTHGTLRDWSRAIPDHRHTTSLVPASYGCDEADVLEAPGIRVTVRRPLAGPGVVIA